MEEWFSTGEFLICDSAYPCSRCTLMPFKGTNLTEDQTDFNTCVAHVRAINEQCIVVLKGKWKSLTELPITIRSAETATEDTEQWIGLQYAQSFIIS